MRRNIRKEILIRDGNLSLDHVTKEDNRNNKQYLYKPMDFYTSVRDEIYIHKTIGTDKNFMTSRLTKNVRKKLFSYFNPTCAKSAKIAYTSMHIYYKTNRPNFCRPARSRTQKQVVINKINKPYVRLTLDSELITWTRSCPNYAQQSTSRL